jgi:hypothetical protein
MTFERLRPADWVALAAALVLLFAMAMDWYSTTTGREARRIEELSRDPAPGQGGEVEREVQERARISAEEHEKNAWQASGAIDRLILFALLAAAGLAVAAGFFRAAGRRFEPPWTPSSLAAGAAALAALLVTYRIIQEPGLDVAATVEAGAPVALVALGVLTVAGAVAMRAEEEGRAFREPRAEPDEDEATA